MSLEEFKQYVISEAKKLYQAEIIKESVENNLSILKEEASSMGFELDSETLKKVRQEMIKKAAGWDFSQPQQLDEKKYSDKASKVIGKEISHLQKDKGYPHDRAVAAAINVAKDKGFKIPKPTNEIDKSAMNAAKKDIEADGHKFEPLGKNKFEKNLNKKELKKAMSPEKTNESPDPMGAPAVGNK